MQFADTVAVLRCIPVFAPLDPPSLKLLAFSSSYLTLLDGEVLCREGEPGDSVYIVQQGALDVVVTHEGREVLIATLGQNDLFGEMAMICNLPRSATGRARGPLQVIKIEGDVFLQLVTGNADAALGVMRVLSERLMRLVVKYEQLQRSSDAALPGRGAAPSGREC